MKYPILVSLATLITGGALFVSACQAVTASIPATETAAPAALAPSATPQPASPTPTIDWFPVTPFSTPFPTPQASPTPEMLTGLGDVLLTDDFSTADDWQRSSTPGGSAALSKDEFTIAISEQGKLVYSLRQQPILGDFYMEITVSTSFCRDMDEYGVVLRGSDETGYRFSLSCDGQAHVERQYNYVTSSLQAWEYGSSIPPGAPSRVRLGVWARGSEMRFFVNNEYQFTVQDTKLTQGQIGVFARSAGEDMVSVNFSDLKVWSLQ